MTQRACWARPLAVALLVAMVLVPAREAASLVAAQNQSPGVLPPTPRPRGPASTVAVRVPVPFSAAPFDFKRWLFGSPVSLRPQVLSVDGATGAVTVGGGDTRQPTTPFIFAWGDGATTVGFFNQSHIYTDRSRNYVVTVTAQYTGGLTDSAQVVVRFVAPVIVPVALDPAFAVSVPNQVVALSTIFPRTRHRRRSRILTIAPSPGSHGPASITCYR